MNRIERSIMEEYKEKKGYLKEKRNFEHDIFIQQLAHELYLDKKYHKEQNNPIEVIFSDCFCNYPLHLTAKEKARIIKVAVKYAGINYGIN